ncbi:HD domain-containing phosphohydrolase [Candidatus Symbiobacter mobilis]|uniref:HD-GYP domain protein n=1 Tax=Candidatus Symbiobacter mobilis CR TaxID=946483 RepID=U5ND55_9BURK|nr:HD domain-containing phosphohydrolase [Candidatus Symbiobacter mobilis]AGX88104.1 HD-GYP domain protein [Candidatus Symbiobacter mobilis CR]
MKPLGRLLKPAWVRRQFDRIAALLPAGGQCVLWVGDTVLAQCGAPAVNSDAVTASCPLRIEEEAIGKVCVHLPATSSATLAQHWANFVGDTAQSQVDAAVAVRAVTQETLESYRELSLLQRAVTELNHSLQPTAVIQALLREFDATRNAPEFGAIFLYSPESGKHSLEQCFGEDCRTAFEELHGSRVFDIMAQAETGDIANDWTHSPHWTGESTQFCSLLWLPLFAHDRRLGLLVLASRQTEAFSAADLKRARTLASVAATALRNAQLYAAEQQMFESFVHIIATTIDAKSPYTAGHCRRVPEIALDLADRAHHCEQGPLAAFSMEATDRKALEIAALLHDCGKVITPEWVVAKATKLEGIVNRADLLALRCEILRHTATNAYLRAIANGQDPHAQRPRLTARLCEIDEDFAFLLRCNLGTEFLREEHIERIHRIAQQRWTDIHGDTHPMLTDDEVYNLCIARGTLNTHERKTIEDHAAHTIAMLSQIRFPYELRNVPEYAAGHHERIDGKGYPRGLTGQQLSVPARIMAIADIFEALTAPDRPYRRPSTLSWAIDTMHKMRIEGHIDSDLFDLFLRDGVYLAYARKHLPAAQIDEVDVAPYLQR